MASVDGLRLAIQAVAGTTRQVPATVSVVVRCQQCQQHLGKTTDVGALRWCKRCKADVAVVARDEGLSGALRDRPGLSIALDAATDALIVWKLDRLSRRVRHLLDIADLLEQRGAALVSITESIDTTSPYGRAIRTVLGTMAELERDLIAERISAGWAERARQGFQPGDPPIGYRREDGLFVPDGHADLVRGLFERYVAGEPVLDICAWAEVAGVTMDRYRLYDIIRRPTYAGRVTYKGRDMGQGKHDALVGADVWEAAQRRRRVTAEVAPMHRQPATYPLSGIARCNACGATMRGTRSGRRSTRMYRCSRFARAGRRACPNSRMAVAERVEDVVGWYVSGMVLDPATAAAVAEPSTSRAQIDVAAVRERQARLGRLYTRGRMPEAEYELEYDRLEAVLEAHASHPAMDPATVLDGLGREWWHAPAQEQAAFVQEVFERITLDGSDVAVMEPRARYTAWFEADRAARFDGDCGRVSIGAPGRIRTRASGSGGRRSIP